MMRIPSAPFALAPGVVPPSVSESKKTAAGEEGSGQFAESLRLAERNRDATPRREDPELRAATREFEAFFLKELLATMRKSIPDGGLFPKSFAHETYEAMMDEELADEMATAGGIGLADMLYDQLSRHMGD